MKISLSDLNIIVDTLLGSSSVADGGTLWNYTAEGRREVAEKLLKEMSNIDLDIEIKQTESSDCECDIERDALGIKKPDNR